MEFCERGDLAHEISARRDLGDCYSEVCWLSAPLAFRNVAHNGV
jgi:hypothetical protein